MYLFIYIFLYLFHVNSAHKIIQIMGKNVLSNSAVDTIFRLINLANDIRMKVKYGLDLISLNTIFC